MRDISTLENVIKQMLVPLRDIPLYLIVESLCGKKVLEYDGACKADLIVAVRNAALAVNKSGIKSARPNEVGNYVEPFLLASLLGAGFAAAKPSTASGKKKSAGYPDLFAAKAGKSFYVEVKTYAKSSEDSPFRSFYLSPSADFKVTRDAYHIIVAFAICQPTSGTFKTESFKVLDAHGLLCDVKYEFQSDNARLYSNSGGVKLIHAEAIS
jgi:hypothetical protein